MIFWMWTIVEQDVDGRKFRRSFGGETFSLSKINIRNFIFWNFYRAKFPRKEQKPERKIINRLKLVERSWLRARRKKSSRCFWQKSTSNVKNNRKNQLFRPLQSLEITIRHFPGNIQFSFSSTINLENNIIQILKNCSREKQSNLSI